MSKSQEVRSQDPAKDDDDEESAFAEFDDGGAIDIDDAEIDDWVEETLGVQTASSSSGGASESDARLLEDHKHSTPTSPTAPVYPDAPAKEEELPQMATEAVASPSNPEACAAMDSPSSPQETLVEPPASTAVPCTATADVPLVANVASGLGEIEPEVAPQLEPEQSDRGQEPERGTSEQDTSTGAAPSSTATKGSGWGSWSSGWQGAWKIASQVAQGAVRDVRELTDSLQQVITSVNVDSDSEGEASGKPGAEDAGPATQPPFQVDATREATPRSRTGSAGGVAAAGSSSSGLEEQQQQQEEEQQQQQGGVDQAPAPAREEVLKRLQGEDTQLEVGLQAIDDQVEQLATGAAKALGSLFMGITGVAKTTLTKVEAATKGLAKDLSAGVSEDVSTLQQAASSSVRGVAANVTRIGSKLERGLETVGRTALNILGEVTGQYNQEEGEGRRGSRSSGGGGHIPRGAAAAEPASFEDFFYLYGGEQLCEELEALSNECARTCNRARAKLEVSQQQALDECTAALGPAFDLDTPAPAAAAHGDAAAGADATPQAEHAGEEGAAAEQALAARYEPIQYLVQDSEAKAAAAGQALLAALRAQQAAQKEAEQQVEAGEQGQAADEQKDEGSAEGVGAAEGGSQLAPALAEARVQACKRVAELCAAQVQLLVDHACSLAAPARLGNPAPGGVPWPAEPRSQALLLRQQCELMVSHVMAVTGGYTSALEALQTELPAAATAATDAADAADGQSGAGSDPTQPEQGPEGAAAALVAAAVSELVTAGDSAVVRVQAGFRGLLYVLLVRHLVTAVATV